MQNSSESYRRKLENRAVFHWYKKHFDWESNRDLDDKWKADGWVGWINGHVLKSLFP